MTERINLPLSALDDAFLQKLKSKYGAHTRLDIQVVNLDDGPALDETGFWNIIDQLDWEADTDQEMLEPAIVALSKHPLGHIYQFEDQLAEKLRALDTPQHAAAAYPDRKYISVDGFLYVRAAVVASGNTDYQEILEQPNLLDPDADFEALLSLAAKAYERKTGQPFDYFAPLSYETYANEEAWQ
jgi:hypothetical protein